MNKNINFFIHELHILNLPLAFFLKFFGNVFVYKYRGFCHRFLRTNFFPSINDFSDVDQWSQQKEATFERLKRDFNNLKDPFMYIQSCGLKVELENLYLQNFAIEYEQYLFFLTLVKNHQGKNIAISTVFRSFLKQHHPNFLSDEQNIHFLPGAFLDTLHIKYLTFLEYLKAFYRLFLIRVQKKDISQYKYLCTGISPSEYPSSSSDLNFAWLVSNNIVPAKDILYILQSPATEKEISFLNNENINFVSINELYSNLPSKVKIKITFDLILAFLKSLFLYNHKKNFKEKSFISVRVWHEIFKIISPQYLICSFSSGWPENPEVTLCKSLKIKYIQWLYSSGEFMYSKTPRPFRDIGIRFSINEASEIWVWNNLVKLLFDERLFPKNPAINIKVMGPILNGNWNVFTEKIDSDFLKKNNSMTVAVFDLTPMKPRMRLNFGEGPFCNTELQEKFYQGILKLYHHFPHIKFIIKTKRFHNAEMYDLVPSLKKLLELNSERIDFPSAKSSPYKAIAEADLTISIPYTSPTMLALSLGRKGLYYDPINLCASTFKGAFDPFTVKNEESLINEVSNYSLEPSEIFFEPISFLEMKKRIQNALN